MPPKPQKPGPTAMTVARNVRRLREGQGLTFADLAARLEAVGHSIATTGLKRIEAARLSDETPEVVTRRVEVDDLTALATALGVSPTSLLTPPPPTDDTEGWQNGEVELTGTPPVSPRRLWHWVRGDSPVDGEETAGAIHQFTARAAVCQAQLTEQHAEQQFSAEGYEVFMTTSDEPSGAVALDRQGRPV